MRGHPEEYPAASTTGMADSENRMSSPFDGAAVMPTVAVTAKAASATKEPVTRTVNHKAKLPQPKHGKASSDGSGNEAEVTADVTGYRRAD